MAEVLSNLSDALATTVASAGQSVLRVEGGSRLPASGIVWSADGLIVTTHHALERDDNIRVGLPDGQTVRTTLAGRDPTTDLAVLRVQATGLMAPTWVGPDDLRVGHLVLALGRPGRTVRATLGIVSALGEGWHTPAGGHLDYYLQTDASMYPGFSGGPLVDVTGEVIGLNTLALLRSAPLTVPTPTVRRVIETLLAHGRIRRGYLGVSIQPVRLPATLAQQLGQEAGLLVVSVEVGGPAERQGLVLGDTIVTVDGQLVRHFDDLLRLLSGDRIGVAVPIRIVRGGHMQELTVIVGEYA